MWFVDLLIKELKFPESPVWSQRDQCLYLVEWTGDRVLCYHKSKLELVFSTKPGGGPSGLGQDLQGNFWVCLYSSQELVHYSANGEIIHSISSYRGKEFRGPCDLVMDKQGGVYFTDSGNFEGDWVSGKPVGAVYYLDPNGLIHEIDRGLCFPNGIALSPEEKKLYVNEHRKNQTLIYELDEFGLPRTKSVFAIYDNDCLLDEKDSFELGPDGLSVDQEGNLWVAHYGGGKIVKINPKGELIQELRLPQGRKPTSTAFQTVSRELFVTEAEYGSLFRYYEAHFNA